LNGRAMFVVAGAPVPVAIMATLRTIAYALLARYRDT
jgi:hypothetical protein